MRPSWMLEKAPEMDRAKKNENDKENESGERRRDGTLACKNVIHYHAYVMTGRHGLKKVGIAGSCNFPTDS